MMAVARSTRPGANRTLSDLVGLLGSSLAMYVADAGIWSYPGEEVIKLALADLVGDQRSIHDRAAAVLDARNLPVPGREYPIRFTATHDVDLRSLLPRIIEELRRQAAALDAIIESTGGDPAADPETLELAREARGTTLGHLDVLTPLAAARQVAPQG
jgi:hypothetical protein